MKIGRSNLVVVEGFVVEEDSAVHYYCALKNLQLRCPRPRTFVCWNTVDFVEQLMSRCHVLAEQLNIIILIVVVLRIVATDASD
jgi:hypothetical protein